MNVYQIQSLIAGGLAAAAGYRSAADDREPPLTIGIVSAVIGIAAAAISTCSGWIAQRTILFAAAQLSFHAVGFGANLVGSFLQLAGTLGSIVLIDRLNHRRGIEVKERLGYPNAL